MKSGWLAFGALIWAAPVLAQGSDPLAPLSAKPANATPRPRSAFDPAHRHRTRTGSVATVQVPRDWRGVFDAIDAGNWASAQAGIAALPRGVLTPVARAELYTAKGSPCRPRTRSRR